MGVLRIKPSVFAGYRTFKKRLGVTAKAVYDKLQKMEPGVSRQLVRETAARLAAVMRPLRWHAAPILPNYRVKILDGNHLRRTCRRVKQLREVNAAPLPGLALVVLDPQSRLVVDAFPCEGGHAQERSLLPQVLATVEPRDVWIDDRHFCTAGFLFGIMERGAYFVTRQHASSLRCEELDRPRKAGMVESGVVYEQKLRIFNGDGRTAVVRRVIVRLHEPMRNGDWEVAILTNLPAKIRATRVAYLHADRWTIETAFAQVATCLQGEIRTLGYPKAALFSFCVALVAYNLVCVVLAALAAVHGEEQVERRLSFYYLATEVAEMQGGLALAIPDRYWAEMYGAGRATALVGACCALRGRLTCPNIRNNPVAPRSGSHPGNHWKDMCLLPAS